MQPLFFSSPTFFPLHFFYFPFPRSFLGGFSGSFCPRLLVFFSVKRLRFSFGMFSNIQRDNTLAFTVTYTLIFVNVLTSSNIQVSLFWSFSFSACYKWIGEEGRIVLLILYGAQQCRVFEQVKLRYLWIWYDRNAFQSFKEECCCLRKKNYEG